MPSFAQLESFLFLSEVLHFSKAAKQLNLSQPALSRQITSLEELIGIQLFIRNKNNLVLTDAGLTFKLSVLPHLEALKLAVLQIEETSSVMEGTIRLGVYPAMGQSFIANLCMEFQVSYPKINIFIELINGKDILDKLRNGKLDFGILAPFDVTESFQTYQLFTETHFLVTKNLSTSQFPTLLPMVAYREESIFLKEFFKLHKGTFSQVKINTVFVVNSHHSILEALRRLPCYAVVPSHVVSMSPDPSEFKIVNHLTYQTDVNLVHIYDPNFSYRNRMLKSFLLKRCKELIP